MASVYERVQSIVAERLGVDEEKVTMDAEFIGDLNADSLDLVEVIMAMEQVFDMEIKDEDAENIRKLSDAVSFIEVHQPSWAAGAPPWPRDPSHRRTVVIHEWVLDVDHLRAGPVGPPLAYLA